MHPENQVTAPAQQIHNPNQSAPLGNETRVLVVVEAFATTDSDPSPQYAVLPVDEAFARRVRMSIHSGHKSRWKTMQLFHLFTVHLTPLGRHQPESVHYTNYYTLAPDLQAAYVRIEGLGGVDQAAEVWGAALPEGHVVNAEAQQGSSQKTENKAR